MSALDWRMRSQVETGCEGWEVSRQEESQLPVDSIHSKHHWNDSLDKITNEEDSTCNNHFSKKAPIIVKLSSVLLSLLFLFL